MTKNKNILQNKRNLKNNLETEAELTQQASRLAVSSQ